MATETLGFEDMSKAQLRSELRSRGEPDHGSRTELVERLQQEDGGGERSGSGSTTGADAPSGPSDANDDHAEKTPGGTATAPDSGQAGGGEREPDPRTIDTGGLGAVEVAGLARQHLEQLTGCPVETISDLVKDEEGWFVRAEVLEIEHINRVADQLGTYDLAMDTEGHPVALSRRLSYQRGLMH